MKIKSILTFFTALLLQQASAQSIEAPYQPKSGCNNYNAFRNGPNLAALKYFADTIYPGGTILFDLSKSSEWNGVESLYPLLGIGAANTFLLVDQTPSRLDDATHSRYQQYYNGVKVEGGGYTVSELGPPGGDPCRPAYMLTPYIASGIHLNAQPNISETGLKPILLALVHQSDTSIHDLAISPELVVTHNLLNDCAYRLTWKLGYAQNGSKLSWIDAYTGAILKTVATDMNINAPTEIYGIQNLNDHTVGNVTKLESPDGSIIAYDFSGFISCRDINLVDFQNNLIVSTTDNEWTESIAPKGLYQAFYVTSKLVPIYKSMGIDFKKINIGAHCSHASAFVLPGSTLDSGFITIGENGSNSLALFDVIGHELAHIYINKFLSYGNLGNIGNQTLHEGISDILGTYVESIVQGTTDWVIGDDNTAIASIFKRNLSDPTFDCYEDVITLGNQHTRSLPLSHWFYLISLGDSVNGITALGMPKAIQIVLEALAKMPEDADYEEFRESTIAIVKAKFGACSPEMFAIGRAWHAICVGPNFENCEFTLTGSDWACEESNTLQLCAEGGISPMHFRWYFPAGWEVLGNASGNVLNDSRCLTVTQFPTYSYYPRYFNIEVHSPSSGRSYKKRIKLIDCDGDDPTCEDYYTDTNQGNEKTASANQVLEQEKSCEAVKIFDITGQLLYESTDKYVFLNPGNLPNLNGLIICTYFDQYGKLVKIKKVFITQ